MTFDDYKTLLHDHFSPCNNQLTAGLIYRMYVCTYICYRLLLLEREMQALEQERAGKKKKGSDLRISKVISLLIMLYIHMPVPPPHQSIIFHVPTNLNPHVENPIENPRKVDYNESFSRIDFSVRDRTDGWQPCDPMR